MAKPNTHVHVRWTGDLRFEAGRPDGPTIGVDSAATAAPSPVDTLVIALATCTSVDVVEILAKRRTPVERYEIDATAERATTIPRRLVAVRLDYHIDGAGIERVHAERAAELAITKYCSVRDSLREDIPVRYSVVLNGEAGEVRDT